MTWFEAEQLAKYIFELENALDEWAYDNPRMRLELAELDKIERKIRKSVQQRTHDNSFRILAYEVLNRAEFCRHEIRERLMA
ncbi:MAG: hypothetical protein JXB18_13150 [Sedimentisphaerales bacterium]|nr:hypothetical protein [Sedimentisphaerales bacterium]